MDQTEDPCLGDARGGGAGTDQLVPSQLASIHGLAAVRARRRQRRNALLSAQRPNLNLGERLAAHGAVLLGSRRANLMRARQSFPPGPSVWSIGPYVGPCIGPFVHLFILFVSLMYAREVYTVRHLRLVVEERFETSGVGVDEAAAV